MWGLPKKIKQKKNVLCENSVEVWGNDGKVLDVRKYHKKHKFV